MYFVPRRPWENCVVRRRQQQQKKTQKSQKQFFYSIILTQIDIKKCRVIFFMCMCTTIMPCPSKPKCVLCLYIEGDIGEKKNMHSTKWVSVKNEFSFFFLHIIFPNFSFMKIAKKNEFSEWERCTIYIGAWVSLLHSKHTVNERKATAKNCLRNEESER